MPVAAGYSQYTNGPQVVVTSKRPPRNRIDRVTTRTGDAGKTSLADGQRYAKHDAKIDLVGALDSANSAIGVLAVEADPTPHGGLLEDIQSRLFDAGAVVATGRSSADWSGLAAALNRQTEAMNADLPPLREFILPGGGRAAAAAHVARSAVRAAERAWWRAADDDPGLAATDVGIYLNRLSDCLFVVARKLATSERLWRPMGR